MITCPRCRAEWDRLALTIPHRPSCKRFEKGPASQSPARALIVEFALGPDALLPPRLIVLVTGGRDYAGAGLVSTLDALASRVVYLVCGDATGADTLAFEWAGRERERRADGLPIRRRHDARWRELGRRAGPERNGRMVADAVGLAKRRALPVLCLAAPGGNGTADCVSKAVVAGLEVRRVA